MWRSPGPSRRWRWAAEALTASIVAAVIVAAIVAIARPLLFASVDGAVAAARGVPVRLLGYGFLALVGAAAAEATQAVGALLLLGLLAAPAGTAQRLTARPYPALFISAGLAVAEMWASWCSAIPCLRSRRVLRSLPSPPGATPSRCWAPTADTVLLRPGIIRVIAGDQVTACWTGAALTGQARRDHG